MPWRIPRARCPRCTRAVRPSDLTPVAEKWVLADEVPIPA